jgi:hypothetical protein
MGSFYNDASLVMIPSGYKDQKVYCAKPADGSGDLVFSRASSATRVQSNGLIEKVRTNLVLQSETFETTWVAQTVTITANATTAPNGTLTADKLVAAVGAGTVVQHRIDQTPTTAAGNNTYSVYAKKGEIEFIFFRIGLSGAMFNLNNGAISSISAGIVASSVDAGNGWYRLIITKAASVANEVLRINLNLTDTFSDFIGNGTDGAFIWGAQYELNDIATDYIPTTTAAVSVGPVSGLPRLDYLNSTCPKLLLEPQRTNLFNFSEQLDNAYWSAIGSLTITANTNVSPDGSTNADRVTTTAAPARIQRAFTGLTAGTRTLSCFVKAGTGAQFRINTYDGIVDKGATFNVATGSVISTGTGVTATITNYGNGWYRVTHNYTSAGTTYSCQFFFDNVGTYEVYGFQFEDLVAYATSYIPTLGASVTRVADAASKTGISSLIGQTQGTFFAEVTINRTLINQNFELSDGTANNRVDVRFTSANVFQFVIVQGGAVVYNQSSIATFAQGQRIKIAAAYKSGALTQLFVNGVSVTSATSGTISGNLTAFFTAQNGGVLDPINSPVSQLLIFKTQLSNAQCQELTTL